MQSIVEVVMIKVKLYMYQANYVKVIQDLNALYYLLVKNNITGYIKYFQTIFDFYLQLFFKTMNQNLKQFLIQIFQEQIEFIEMKDPVKFDGLEEKVLALKCIIKRIEEHNKNPWEFIENILINAAESNVNTIPGHG